MCGRETCSLSVVAVLSVGPASDYVAGLTARQSTDFNDLLSPIWTKRKVAAGSQPLSATSGRNEAGSRLLE